MNFGQRRPSSKERTVPDTAPIAKRMDVPFAHGFASSRYAGFRVRSQRPSAMIMSRGMAIPATAKTMWKPSETAICVRAAVRSVMRGC